MRKLLLVVLLGLYGCILVGQVVLTAAIGFHLLALGVQLTLGLTVSVLDVLLYVVVFSVVTFGLQVAITKLRRGW